MLPRNQLLRLADNIVKRGSSWPTEAGWWALVEAYEAEIREVAARLPARTRKAGA